MGMGLCCQPGVCTMHVPADQSIVNAKDLRMVCNLCAMDIQKVKAQPDVLAYGPSVGNRSESAFGIHHLKLR